MGYSFLQFSAPEMSPSQVFFVQFHPDSLIFDRIPYWDSEINEFQHLVNAQIIDRSGKVNVFEIGFVVNHLHIVITFQHLDHQRKRFVFENQNAVLPENVVVGVEV